MTVLPEDELDAFTLAVDTAVGFAQAGRPGDGYVVLLTGLAYAGEMRKAGQPWAPELVTRYEEARERFAER